MGSSIKYSQTPQSKEAIVPSSLRRAGSSLVFLFPVCFVLPCTCIHIYLPHQIMSKPKAETLELQDQALLRNLKELGFDGEVSE